jgi:caffeoyl-CoA O-methyltransferase
VPPSTGRPGRSIGRTAARVCDARAVDLVDPRAEAYAIAHTTQPDSRVSDLRAETEETMPAPQMAGGYVEVKLLEALIAVTSARRVLEIGTFTGVSAISMASRLPPDGVVITLEVDETHAAVARRHIAASPYRDRIQLLFGDALASIDQLEGPFDLVFIDAWKRDYPTYYEAVLPKLAERGIIVADNMLRSGTVLDPDPDDVDARALAEFADRVQADPRVDNALLTVADGLLLAWRAAERLEA